MRVENLNEICLVCARVYIKSRKLHRFLSPFVRSSVLYRNVMKRNLHRSFTAGYSMRNRTEFPVPEYAKTCTLS